MSVVHVVRGYPVSMLTTMDANAKINAMVQAGHRISGMFTKIISVDDDNCTQFRHLPGACDDVYVYYLVSKDGCSMAEDLLTVQQANARFAALVTSNDNLTASKGVTADGEDQVQWHIIMHNDDDDDDDHHYFYFYKGVNILHPSVQK